MDKRFLEKFIQASNEVVRQSKTTSWPIPPTADKTKGDLGLLPDDPSIEAWQIPASSAMLLRFLVLATKSKTIFELGTSIGFSTMWLALGAKETGGRVYTTEIFAPKAELAKKNFKAAGISEQIELIERDITEVLKSWKQGPIDFVFMDADKQRYVRYLELMFPVLADHALIVVDNVGNYRQYMLDFLKSVGKLEKSAVHFLNVDNGLLLISKNAGENLASVTDIYNPNTS